MIAAILRPRQKVNHKPMRKLIYKPTQKPIILIVTFAVFLFAVICVSSNLGGAKNVKKTIAHYQAKSGDEYSEDGIKDKTDEIINNLDEEKLNDLMKDFSTSDYQIFGSLSFSDKLRAIAGGNDGTDFNSVFTYLINIFLGDITGILPFFLSILGVCVAFSVISNTKGKFATESVSAIIRFAAVGIIAVILSAQIMSLVSAASKTVSAISDQINAVFPIILTLMSATGASGSVAAYTPAVAILGGTLSTVISVFALPCFILSVVLNIVGNLSDAVRLKKMSDFFMSALKWVLGTAFFVFLAFLSVKGITASIRDGISIRTAKFAISNYIPIIGGYLSEGFNMVMAGSVIIKNALGLSSMILLLITVLPLIVKIIVFSLVLSLLGAITEPLGLDGISSILSGISKSVKSLVAIIAGMAFLYFVFLLLTVCSGNLVL